MDEEQMKSLEVLWGHSERAMVTQDDIFSRVMAYQLVRLTRHDQDPSEQRIRIEATKVARYAVWAAQEYCRVEQEEFPYDE